MAIKLFKASVEIEVIFVGDSDWSDAEMEGAADRAMAQCIRDERSSAVDEISSLTCIPFDWKDALPYDPEGLCETEETVKEMFEKHEQETKCIK